MKSYDDLAAICRTLDAYARGAGERTFPDIFARFGIDEGGVAGVAQQRALRAYLISRGRELPRTNEPVKVDIPPGGEEELVALSAAWLDGLVVGLTLMRPRWDRVTTDENGGR